jgi:hypothetical protein
MFLQDLGRVHIFPQDLVRGVWEANKAKVPQCPTQEMKTAEIGAKMWCSSQSDGNRKQRACTRCEDAYDRLNQTAKVQLVKDSCKGDYYMYHTVTDAALSYLHDRCPDCTHLLLTSEHNVYSTDFFAELLSEDSDLSTSDFWDSTEQRYVQARALRPDSGLEMKNDMNLGATLINIEMFKSHTFLGAAR